MERSLADRNKIQNSKNNKLFILAKNTVITLNCFVRRPAVISPAGKRAECENNTCLPFSRTVTHEPKLPLSLAFSWRDS
jgi:hypothetical protein